MVARPQQPSASSHRGCSWSPEVRPGSSAVCFCRSLSTSSSCPPASLSPEHQPLAMFPSNQNIDDQCFDHSQHHNHTQESERTTSLFVRSAFDPGGGGGGGSALVACLWRAVVGGGGTTTQGPPAPPGGGGGGGGGTTTTDPPRPPPAPPPR